jgi:hypothetical protein
VDNERVLEGEGWDVKGMREWWAERKRSKATAAATANATSANLVPAGRKEHMGGRLRP